jgi:hypothetical protein
MFRVIHLKGGPALSDFRIDKLLAGLKAQGIASLAADYRYFVELRGDLDEAELAFLGELLQAEPHTPEADLVLIVPRLGTVSPPGPPRPATSPPTAAWTRWCASNGAYAGIWPAGRVAACRPRPSRRPCPASTTA